jgi:hypothetical protein
MCVCCKEAVQNSGDENNMKILVFFNNAIFPVHLVEKQGDSEL